jgi:hypothetical protein
MELMAPFVPVVDYQPVSLIFTMGPEVAGVSLLWTAGEHQTHGRKEEVGMYGHCADR